MSKTKKRPVLLLHGGAAMRALSAAKRLKVHESFQRILGPVHTALEDGLPALEAVQLAVMELENDPLFNAGKGSKIQSDGKIRMSASLMDGDQRRFGGCVNVQRVKNPICLARLLMTEKDRVLAGTGAERFARQKGLTFASPYTEHQLAEYWRKRKGKTGTVGAVALDVKGRLAAATSTGGKGGEFPNRVSDSPTAAGNYACRLGAVSATGTGEEIVEFAVASRVCAFLEAGLSLDEATRRILHPARQTQAEFGFIALDASGDFRAVTTTASLLWAVMDKQGRYSGFKR